MGTWGNVLINHLLHVIPISYPCHYTHLCPHICHKTRTLSYSPTNIKLQSSIHIGTEWHIYAYVSVVNN